MALTPTRENGPAARSFPTGQARGLKAHADAHDCIMVRIQTILPNTSLSQDALSMASSPWILNRQTGTDPSPKRCKSPVAVHRRSACSGVKRCETQAPLRRHAAKLCYRFGPLTPSARSANLIAGDGAKNGSPAPNKEPTIHKQSLDSKSPIQVRIRFPPAKSLRTFGP